MTKWNVLLNYVCFVKWKNKTLEIRFITSASKKLCLFPIYISNHDWLLAKWKPPITRGNPKGHWFKHFFSAFFSQPVLMMEKNTYFIPEYSFRSFLTTSINNDFLLLYRDENHLVLEKKWSHCHRMKLTLA